MPSRVPCQFCGFVNRVRTGRDGEPVDCGKCGARLIVPDFEPDRPANADMSSFGLADNDEFSALPGRRFWGWMLGGMAAIVAVVLLISFAQKIGPKLVNGPRGLPGVPRAPRRVQPPGRARFPHARDSLQIDVAGCRRGDCSRTTARWACSLTRKECRLSPCPGGWSLMPH